MKNISVLLAIIVILTSACKRSGRTHVREMIIGGNRVVGNISDDTIYTGLIRFYNGSSNVLSEEVEYNSDGRMNGKRTLFYPNGNTRALSFYDNGKRLGYNTLFDSTGKIANNSFWYYDIRVGPSVDYYNGKPSRYYFYTFENELLYYLNYDELTDKKIVDLERNYFRLVKYDSASYWQGNLEEAGTEYRIYLLNPPKYKFDYDIVHIDSAYHVMDTIDRLDVDLPFANFTIRNSRSNSFFPAVRLTVEDSMNSKNDYLMFKKIL
jgi:hypothetical protein